MLALPDTPAGRQLQWYLATIAAAGEGASWAADRDRLAPTFDGGPLPNANADYVEGWRNLSRRIGPFEVASIDETADLAIAVTLDAGGKRWRAACEVEAQAPHCITSIVLQRLFDFDVSVREATEADGPALAEIERRCPIVLSDRSVTFDRGDDYFAFARLMEDVTVGLGLVEGVPAAINCGAVHNVRIGGEELRVMTAIHTRILPEHQRKGLWGAVSDVLSQKYPRHTIAGSRGYVSVDNAAMQQGFANMPDKWPAPALRAQLSCDSLAGPAAGRPATPADALRIVEILNACHDGEEQYLPYTVESLTARLERAPAQYSWERVWLSERTVAGVWPAGESIRVIIESNGRRAESRRGLVLDYGFLPGAEDELEALLRGWCGWLAGRGLDTLSIFTSALSPGYDRLRGLASEVEAFDFWTPGIAVPPGASERGLYVDQVYF